MNKLLEELQRVIITTFYLYVCFGAVLLYRMAVLHNYGISYAPWGLAAIKALILGKFVLLGRAFRLGARPTDRPLIYPILRQSAVFLVMLIALSIAEEVIKGFFHGETLLESVSDLGGWLQIAATALLLWLVLLPYLGFIQLSEALGENRLREIIWGR